MSSVNNQRPIKAQAQPVAPRPIPQAQVGVSRPTLQHTVASRFQVQQSVFVQQGGPRPIGQAHHNNGLQAQHSIFARHGGLRPPALTPGVGPNHIGSNPFGGSQGHSWMQRIRNFFAPQGHHRYNQGQFGMNGQKAASVLARNFRSFDTAAFGGTSMGSLTGWGKSDGVIGKIDMQAVAANQNGQYSPKEVAAAQYFLANPDQMSALDNGSIGGSTYGGDGKLNMNDINAYKHSNTARYSPYEGVTQGQYRYNQVQYGYNQDQYGYQYGYDQGQYGYNQGQYGYQYGYDQSQYGYQY